MRSFLFANPKSKVTEQLPSLKVYMATYGTLLNLFRKCGSTAYQYQLHDPSWALQLLWTRKSLLQIKSGSEIYGSSNGVLRMRGRAYF
jgi:hypothetical protein